MNSEQVLDRQLQAIADPTRRRILRVLKEKARSAAGKDASLSASDIEERIQLSQPTISHHMSVLTRAGLVEAKKIGHWRWYRRSESALRVFTRSLKASL